MNRILIIGLNGSGKSTLANKLGKKLNREVIHLDRHFYEPGWKHIQTENEWKQTIRDLVSKENWIIEGQYTSTLDIRLPRATTVIFLNFNKLLCLYRTTKRIFDKNILPDKAEGDSNHLSLDLVKKIIKYPKKKILAKLKLYKDAKKIIILKNRREVEHYLSTLVK